MWLKRGLIFTRAYFIAVIIAMYSVGLTFGYGLGDLFYLFMQIAWIIILSITLKIVSRREKLIGPILTITILLFLLTSIVFITTEFTINRGNEYPWNGKFFMRGTEMKQQK